MTLLKKFLLLVIILITFCLNKKSIFAEDTSAIKNYNSIEYDFINNIFKQIPPINEPFLIDVKIPTKISIKEIILTINSSERNRYYWEEGITSIPESNGEKKYSIFIYDSLPIESKLIPKEIIISFQWQFKIDITNQADDELRVLIGNSIDLINLKLQTNPNYSINYKDLIKELANYLEDIIKNSRPSKDAINIDEKKLIDEVTDFINKNTKLIDYTQDFIMKNKSNETVKKNVISSIMNSTKELYQKYALTNIIIKTMIATANVTNYNYLDRQKLRLDLDVGLMYLPKMNDHIFPFFGVGYNLFTHYRDIPLYKNGYLDGLLSSSSVIIGIGLIPNDYKHDGKDIHGVWGNKFLFLGLGCSPFGETMHIQGGMALYKTDSSKEGEFKLNKTYYLGASINVDVFNWIYESYGKITIFKGE